MALWAASAVHGDGDAGVLEHGGELQAGELAALVGVEDLGAAVAFQSLAEGLCAEAGIEGVGEPPGEHPAGGPVHDGYQVQEALLDGDVGVGVGPERPVVFRPMGFSGPPSEPDVRLSPHPAVLIPSECLTKVLGSGCSGTDNAQWQFWTGEAAQYGLHGSSSQEESVSPRCACSTRDVVFRSQPTMRQKAKWST